MNIFYLDPDPVICAQYHCDKHVVKMIIEYAQLMSTAHRILDGDQYLGKSKLGRNIKRWLHPEPDMEEILYKASHINHPSAVWTRQSKQNYDWLYNLWFELCSEYTHRYGKEHLTWTKLMVPLGSLPKNIPDVPITVVPQAMPDHCKMDDPIDAYRNYYKLEKQSFAKWTKRDIPEWFDGSKRQDKGSDGRTSGNDGVQQALGKTIRSAGTHLYHY